MRKNLYNVLAVLMLFVAVSCDKKEADVLENNQEHLEYWVENGVLHVKNEEVLNRLMQENAKKSTEELKAWEEKLGFESYKSFYNQVFSEYEDMRDAAVAANSDEPYYEFKSMYEDYVDFPSELIEGAPNRSIAPKVDFSLMTLANREGELVVDDSKKNATVKKAAPDDECYVKTKKRKTWIRIYWGTTIQVTCKKKTMWAWWEYSTTLHWRPFADEKNVGFEKWKVRSGDQIHISSSHNYVEAYTSGSGFSRRCKFSK